VVSEATGAGPMRSAAAGRYSSAVADYPVPVMRLSDAEREAALTHLRQLVASDQLSIERFSDLAGAVVASTTHDDLASALGDVPSTVRYTPPERRLTRPLVLRSKNSSIRMAGRWQLAARTEVRTSNGSILLDLTHAEFDAPVIELDVRVGNGTATIVVPEGITVVIVGGSGIRNHLGEDVPLPGAPVVRLRTSAKNGTVRLRRPLVKRERRRWWRRRGDLS